MKNGEMWDFRSILMLADTRCGFGTDVMLPFRGDLVHSHNVPRRCRWVDVMLPFHGVGVYSHNVPEALLSG